MANDATCSHHVRVQLFAGNVRRWIGERPYRSDLGRRYEGFALNVAAKLMTAASRLSYKGTPGRLIGNGLSDALLDVL